MEHNLEELEVIAKQFDTDKQAGQNEYLGLYLEYFQRQGFKRDAPLDILEIGTNKGSSLRMWAEYFPNAQIYGLDITRDYELPDVLEHDRIKTEIADQGNPQQMQYALSRLGKPYPFIHTAIPERKNRLFHIIIDDGSHDQYDQQISWGYLWQWLHSNGLYVIEDIITGENWWDANLYNKKRIMPTRGLVQTFEQTGKLDDNAMPRVLADNIEESAQYCEYRESPAVIYTRHHPQVAFIGKQK